mgnify:CR=1 FL=1
MSSSSRRYGCKSLVSMKFELITELCPEVDALSNVFSFLLSLSLFLLFFPLSSVAMYLVCMESTLLQHFLASRIGACLIPFIPTVLIGGVEEGDTGRRH